MSIMRIQPCKRAFVLACLLGFVGLCGQSAHAQAYFTSTGIPPFSTPDPFQLGFADTANGHLHIVIRLGSYPQRGTSKAEEVSLMYDSNIWRIQSNSLSSWWLQDNAGNNGGWQLSEQIVSKPVVGGGTSGCRQDEPWMDRNGTVHIFPMPSWASDCTYPASAYASDSSGFVMVMPSYGTKLVYAPDGTLAYSYPPVADATGHYILAEDSNGNYIAGNALYPSVLYDTLGRMVVQTPGGSSIQTSIPTSQGSALFQPTWTTITLNTNFQLSGVSECTATPGTCSLNALRSLTLPDGSTYSFTYDCDSSTGNPACSSPHSQTYYYGELTSVTLPTGGVVRYTYTMFKDAYNNNTRWLSSRSGGSGATYIPSVITTCSSGGVGCQQKTTVIKQDSSTVTTFTLNNGAWPTTIVTTSGTAVTTVNNTWDFSQSCVLIGCHGASYVRLLSQMTTMTTASGSITKKTVYSYDTPQKGNVTAVKEWKFYPGTSPTFPTVPDRATYVTYYTAGHIINKPQKTTLCNNVGSDPDCPGGGSKVSQTIVTYDSYGGNLTLVSGAANHDDTNFGTGTTARGNPTQIQEWVSGSNYLTSTRQYDTTGQVLKMIDPAGSATLYSYDDSGAFYTDNGVNPPQSYTPATKTNAYVTRVTLPTVASGTMTLSRGYYYGSGKLAMETDQNGAKSYHHFVDNLDRPTANSWPATNGTQSAIGGNVLSYPSITEADVYVPVSDALPSSACTSCRQSQFLYDTFGRKSTEALLNAPGGPIKVDTAYDTLGRVQSVSHPYVNVSDPTHVLETFAYDGFNREIAVIHPDAQSLRSKYGADVAGLGGKTTQSSTSFGYGYPVVAQDESSKQKQQWTDGFGRVIEVDEPATNTGTSGTGAFGINFDSSQVSITYNPCAGYGQQCWQTLYNSGNVSITIGGYTVSAYYDNSSTAAGIASQLANGLNSLSSPVTATANGAAINVKAVGVGASTNLSFSASATYYQWTCGSSPCFYGPAFYASPSSGALTGGSGGLSSSSFSTYYAYDVAGRLTQVSQGVQTRTFVYDGLGRATTISTPEGGTDILKYDSDANCAPPNSFTGHLVSKTDARGIRTCFQRDALGRVTLKTYSNGQGSVTYAYDQGGAAAFALGRLTKITDPSGSETYTYDTQGAGRITRLSKIVGTTTYNIDYEYNTAGEITKITYPSGRAVQRNLDAIGRLSSIVDSKGGVNTTRASGYTYNKSQQVTGFSYGNGVNAAFSFSPLRDELTALSYAKGTLTLFSLNYLYQNDPTNCPSGTAGNNGQILCVNDDVDPGRSVAYTYDSLGRAMTAVTNGSTGYPKWGLSWAYDRYGNRLNQTVTAGSSYPNTLTFGNPGGAQTNRPDGMCFDGSGNLTAESGSCPPAAPMYTYDADNRMTAYMASAAYVYDAGGKRVKKCLPNCTNPTSRTVYIFSAGKDIAEYDNGAAPSSPSREHIYSGESLLTTISGSTSSYRHPDHLSLRLWTDSSGAKLGEQGHYPYGETWYQAGTTTKIIFTSYERDSESGNDYALGRYYHVRFGRFCTPDPLMGNPSDPQSWNRYLYVRDNPIGNIDPSGFSWLSGLFKAIVDFFVGAFPTSSPTIVPTFPTSSSGEGVWDKILDAIAPPMNPIIDESGGFGTGFMEGGGGVDASTNYTSLLADALTRVRADLAKDPCAKHFKNVRKTLKKLDDVGFGNHGVPTFKGEKTKKGDYGDYNPLRVLSGAKTIQLNSQINWSDPNNTPDVEDGRPGIYRAADAEARELGEKQVTPAQLMDITLLHELEHYNGTANPDNPSVEKGLWDDCVKH